MKSSVKTPPSVNRIDVETAAEMRDEVLAQLPGHDILIMSAAVSDFKASHVAKSKIKKTRKKDFTLELLQTRDILKDVMGKRKAKQKQGAGFRDAARGREKVRIAAAIFDQDVSASRIRNRNTRRRDTRDADSIRKGVFNIQRDQGRHEEARL